MTEISGFNRRRAELRRTELTNGLGQYRGKADLGKGLE